jgi:hypothetical protein
VPIPTPLPTTFAFAPFLAIFSGSFLTHGTADGELGSSALLLRYGFADRQAVDPNGPRRVTGEVESLVLANRWSSVHPGALRLSRP